MRYQNCLDLNRIQGGIYMISGINNGFYSYQASLNQLRLTQMLQNRYSGLNAVNPVSKANPVTSGANRSTTLSSAANYINQYTSSMTDLMSSANALRGGNSQSAVNQVTAKSSDASVLEASARYKLTSPASYEVNVSQLAAEQVSQTEGVTAGASASGDISFTIAGNKGSKEISVSAAYSNGSAKTNLQQLNDTAKAVNAANVGVTATVVTEDGKSSLKLTSAETGTRDGSFSVTGGYADASGLSKATQEAQDAVYTVSENGTSKEYTSGSNKVSIGYGKFDVTLKKEGTASITTGADSDKITKAMSDFVDSYNETVNLLSSNADRGSGNIMQLKRLATALGSEQGMERMGLSFNKDGTLTLDKEKLTKNLEESPSLTKDLISGSSGLAQRTFSAAQSGLNSSVSSVIQSDLQNYSYEQSTSSINFMNSFARSGVYNMANYNYMGMFINTYM